MVVVSTIIVVNKVCQGVLLIPIPFFWIQNINNTMNVYIVFTFSIVVYIPTTIFTLKPHSTLLKMAIKVVLLICIQLFIMLHVNNILNYYTINSCCYYFEIAGYSCYCFVHTIKNNRDKQGKCIYLPRLNAITVRFES